MTVRLNRFLPAIILLLLSACAGDSERVDEGSDLNHGRSIYQAHCQECHGTGKNGAPALSDSDEWDDRSFIWQPMLAEHVQHGFLGMPAKGGHSHLNKQDIDAALRYMDMKIQLEED